VPVNLFVDNEQVRFYHKNESGFIMQKTDALSTFLTPSKPVALAVIGDVCLDLAYQVTTEGGEVSVETGLQTYSVQSVKGELGGGCNVGLNLKTLGAQRVDMYGIVGSDLYGKVLCDLLESHQLDTEGVQIQEEAWATHVYHKVFEQGVEHPRFDSGNFNVPSDRSIDMLLHTLRKKIDAYDAIIINEQVPQGLHNTVFQERLNKLLDEYEDKVLWFADCRKLNSVYRNAIHKVNEAEGRALDPAFASLSTQELVRALYTYFGKPTVVTLGENGAVGFDGETFSSVLGVHFTQQIDIVGAGDAFLAAMVLSMSRGASLAAGIEVGNLSAAQSLLTLYGCGHPTVEEILELRRRASWRYNPEKASDGAKRVFDSSGTIEIVDSVPKRGLPKIAIFDHDGTISTMRSGWEGVMAKMMKEAIAGPALPVLTTEEIANLEAEIAHFIDQTTGIQTIEQMVYLKEMVERHGYVPSDEILSAQEYKNVYNDDLLAMIASKKEGVANGTISPDEVTMAGSVEFLHYLHKRGVKLYLASGTDQADVVKEATLLGYADLFGGRIYGSVGKIDEDPKKVVLSRMIASLAGQEDDIIVFGDGPVEMREARSRGVLAVGILSDEVRRKGENLAKRQRLILGGASLLMPDFAFSKELVTLLGWNSSEQHV
jgi:sugar/nucleoside kinase (ribokinase family)/phosphoglycolate phosphatase-like HAD superfamily hydrolase